jgi:hypothetical protein
MRRIECQDGGEWGSLWIKFWVAGVQKLTRRTTPAAVRAVSRNFQFCFAKCQAESSSEASFCTPVTQKAIRLDILNGTC